MKNELKILLQQSKSKTSFSRRNFFALTGVAALLGMVGNLAPWGLFSTSPAAGQAQAATGGGRLKNILVVTGSARAGGNSDLLAEAFVKGARETGHTVNVFHSGRDRMSGCLNCGGCFSTGDPCVVRDNFGKLFPLLEQADMVVFCSPLYMYSFSGHIKNAMDRLHAYKKDMPRQLRIKEAMLLMCGETWFKKSFDGAAESYRQFLGYKGWDDCGRLFATSVKNKGDIVGDSALQAAEKMGRDA